MNIFVIHIMNIAILTGPFFPNMSPSSACIDKYIQYLKNKYHIHIICQRSSYIEEQYCVGNVQLHYVSNRINDLRNRCIWNIGRKKIYYFSKILLFLIRAYGVLRSYFAYPTRISWLIDKYYDELSDLESLKHIDVLISVSNPVCTHLAAQRFKRKIMYNTKWITYNTDPFTYYTKSYSTVINKRRRMKRNFRTESSYYKEADYNIFTEELFYSAIHDFKICEEKCICFPYVFSDFKLLSNNSLLVDGLGICKLVYAGALNKEIRNPEYALSVLRNVSRIDLYLYQAGDCNDIIDRYASSHIKVNGLLQRDQYVDLICNKADILVNIGNNSKLQAPSKLLELLSTGKPILNFNYYKDSQYEMIEKYPLGLNVGRDDECAVRKVQDFCDNMKGRSMDIDMIKNIFPENSIENQLNKLESLF